MKPRPAKTAARGYGGHHQNLRARWARRVATGDVTCARCGKPIAPGSSWDLGHSDTDRSVYTGPEHTACNRKTATHRAQRRTRPPSRQRLATLLAWYASDEFADDPDRNLYWGPPSRLGQPCIRWSRPWFDWRSEPNWWQGR